MNCITIWLLGTMATIGASCAPVTVSADLIAKSQKKCLARNSTLLHIFVYHQNNEIRFQCKSDTWGTWEDEWPALE